MNAPVKSDRYLITALLIILSALLFWLGVHLGIIGGSVFKEKNHLTSTGYVSESYGQLKRKHQEAIQWEKASINDEVYNFDSVMTLEKSQATIRLNNGSEIHLAENTMITLEPATTAGDIRMRLAQGNFRATSGDQPSKIETNQGTIDLEKNSQVTVKQAESGKLEVEAQKGSFKLSGENVKQNQSPFQTLSPNPRETVKTDQDVIFSWSKLNKAESYRLIFTDQSGKISFQKNIKGNSFPYRFKNTAKLKWKIIGLDEDGKELSATMTQEITAEATPFEAPEVQEPEVRVPSNEAKPGALLFRLFIQEAFAAELEAVFSWKPISGADYYTIEVSASTDFKYPIFASKTTKNEFVWKDFPAGTYFWRVAAGSTSGRSGVFSKPTKVNLKNTAETAEPVDGVLIRKSLEAQAQMTPVNTDTDEILKEQPKAKMSDENFAKPFVRDNEDARKLKGSYLIEVDARAAGWTLNDDKSNKATLDSKNSTSSGAHFQTEQKYAEDKSFLIDVSYLHHSLTPKLEVINPLVKDQTFDDVSGKLLFGNENSSLLRGIVSQTIPTLENNEIKSNAAIGAGILYLTGEEDTRHMNSFALDFLAGSSLFTLSLENKYRYQYAKWESSALSLGLAAKAEVISVKSATSYRWNAGITLGLEFF